MTQIFGAPGRYVQGYGEIRNVRKHLSWIGDPYLIIASRNRIKDLGQVIKESFGEGFKIVFAQFGGESTRQEVERLVDIAEEEGCKGVIGLGGGRVIDAAKAVGYYLKTPTVIIPTIAATDASPSSCSILYHEDGTFDEELALGKNPDVVLVDTEIIMNAPVRFLVAGMGDALSTYPAARVCYEGYKDSDLGGKPSETSITLAKLSYDILMKHGLLAKIACEQKVLTKDLNKVIETNVLLSGLGFETNGGASDHSFYYGFCSLTDREEHMYHGEYVAFSTLCMLVMDGVPKEELDEVYRFCISVGLPVCFGDLKMENLTEEEYRTMAEATLSQAPTHNHPYEVTAAEAIAAMKTADALGKMYKEGGSLV